ncbi:MAG: alpha/beta hydrolase [Acidobacteria bacterium]|nr:alpha/beta hydrolase [Acidobacteriota bacterium]
MLTLAIALFGPLIALLGVLLAWSWPGRPKPFRGPDGRPVPGSISEKIRVEVNGVSQGMFIKARNAHKPVLLYLHGGMPDYFLTQKYPTGLDDEFVVCWWEQRGSGLSYDALTSGQAITAAQLIADTIEVTNYLRRRFGQERIFLMGHSGGSFIGIQAAARAPELYRAYVGVAQVSSQLHSECRAYEHMLKQYRRQGDARMARRLEAAPVSVTSGVPARYLTVRDQAMHRLGVGTMRHMRSVVTGIFIASLQNRDYTLREKIGLWRGKASAGVSTVWSEMLASDLSEQVPRLDVPVYLLHGRHDYTCSFDEALAYFDRLQAPLKGFYAFEASAHSPIFEEPGRVCEILRADVLAGTNGLADLR